ncbi:hypothetical protein PQG02_10480 [Nostoc sp. UHCC 0926]|nr:hypothetical protein PQG02_10480 [Nostoc sp. UHCC 0926]
MNTNKKIGVYGSWFDNWLFIFRHQQSAVADGYYAAFQVRFVQSKPSNRGMTGFYRVIH